MNEQELHYSKIMQHYNNLSNCQNRVLVHCAMGKSRSATAFIMFVMRRFGLSMDDAFEFCKT